MKRPWPLALAILVVLWAVGFSALDRYGVTWDEALGDLFFGQRYASFWGSFDAGYLDFEADPYPADHRPDLRASPFRTRPWEHYPVGATVGAVSSVVFDRGLGVLDAFDGFHAGNLVLAAIFVFVFVPFLARRYGALVAVVASVVLFTQPRVFAHMMTNIKDFPLMIVWSLGVIAFLVAYERGSVRGLIGAGALWGVALATKANGLFAPAIPMVLVIVDLARRRLPEAWKARGRQLAAGLIAAALTGPLVMIALWPYLWADPVGRLGKNLAFIAFRKGTTRSESMAPVLESILLTTPVIVLVLGAIGFARAVLLARRGDRAALVLAIWIPAVLARYLVPSAVNYDGVRHFLEIFPALAALVGLAVAWIASWVGERIGRERLVAVATTIVVMLPMATTLVAAHPFELAYWNPIAGGLSGAREKGLPQAGDYWGASYRLGLEWLNRNAPPGAYVAVPVIEHAVRLMAPERLREDLTVVPLTSPFRPQIDSERLAAFNDFARRHVVYVMFVDRADWTNRLMAFCQQRLEPEASWTQDGAPVLRIYRYGTSGGPTP